jgi:hypothetical protein
MSESAKAAQTLVWRASGGDADKTYPICASAERRNPTLLGEKEVSRLGEKEVSRCSAPIGYHGCTIYIQILIPLARYRR